MDTFDCIYFITRIAITQRVVVPLELLICYYLSFRQIRKECLRAVREGQPCSSHLYKRNKKTQVREEKRQVRGKEDKGKITVTMVRVSAAELVIVMIVLAYVLAAIRVYGVRCGVIVSTVTRGWLPSPPLTFPTSYKTRLALALALSLEVIHLLYQSLLETIPLVRFRIPYTSTLPAIVISCFGL